MPVSGEKERQRASAFETLGAWLRIWTPPRDVEVPPLPKRALIGVAAGILLVALGVAAFVAPQINDSKQRAEARDRAAEQAQRAATARRIRDLQRATIVSFARRRPPAGSSAGAQLAARSALVAEVEKRITADAQARAADGEWRRPSGPTTCAPKPGTPAAQSDLAVRRGVFNCDTTVVQIKATETNEAGSLAYPFRAVIDFKTFRVAWCRTNPPSGELSVPDPRHVVQLPAACRA